MGEALELRGMPKVARADVAHFIVREIENPRFVRKVVVTSGPD